VRWTPIAAVDVAAVEVAVVVGIEGVGVVAAAEAVVVDAVADLGRLGVDLVGRDLVAEDVEGAGGAGREVDAVGGGGAAGGEAIAVVVVDAVVVVAAVLVDAVGADLGLAGVDVRIGVGAVEDAVDAGVGVLGVGVAVAVVARRDRVALDALALVVPPDAAGGGDAVHRVGERDEREVVDPHLAVAEAHRRRRVAEDDRLRVGGVLVAGDREHQAVGVVDAAARPHQVAVGRGAHLAVEGDAGFVLVDVGGDPPRRIDQIGVVTDAGEHPQRLDLRRHPGSLVDLEDDRGLTAAREQQPTEGER
jgi:hypothetical protein